MLDQLIPLPRLIETNGVDLAAPPDRVWQSVRHRELIRSPLMHALFALRTWPERAAGRNVATAVRLDELRSSPERPGFQLLEDHPPSELAVGAIGKVWRLAIPFVHVANAEEFAAFSQPGFVKVAWAVRVEPRAGAGSHVDFELRVSATDDDSWRAFERYFAVIGPFSRFIRGALLAALVREFGARDVSTRAARDGVIGVLRDVLTGFGGLLRMVLGFLTPFLRGARSHWGLDAALGRRVYPGDERVPEPRWQWTHAVEIAAGAERVWPWIAQIGADRAGFYSYEWLENLVGCHLRNAATLHPEWELHAGDAVVLHPKMPPLRVASLERGRYFVVHGPVDEQARAAGQRWAAASWLFLIEPLGEHRCRLISRYRLACSEDRVSRLSFGPTLLEPISFAMDRRMLLEVKRRAEASTVARTDCAEDELRARPARFTADCGLQSSPRPHSG